MPNIALIEGNKLSDSGSDLTAISGQTYSRLHSGRDFPNGTLIETTIDYSVTNGDPWVLEITGNSYTSLVPFNLTYQGYIYNNTTINVGGISVGAPITGMSLFNYNGKLCFWFPYQSYWQGFNVYAYSALSGRKENRVTAITNVAKPAGVTKEVSMTFQQVVRTSSSTVGTTNYVSKFSANNVLTDSQIFDNGTNVGIGTASPFSKFTISGTASTSQISIVNTEGGHFILRSGIPGVSNNGTSFVTADVDGSNQNTRMVISSTGNLGIGTASPGAKLEVAAGHIKIADSYAYYWGGGSTLISGNSNANTLSLSTNNTARLYINSAGDIGINTNSPAGKLDVVGASSYFGIGSSSDTFLFLRGYNGGLIRFQSNSGFSGTYNGLGITTNSNGVNSLPSWNFDFGGQDGVNFLADAFSIYRKPNGGSYTGLFAILSSGETLVGRTTAVGSHRLQVNGNISINGSGSYLDFQNGDVRFVNSSGNLSIQTYSATTTLTTKVYISGTGNVGINTSDPDSTTLRIIPTSTDAIQRTLHIGYNGSMSTGTHGSLITFGNTTPSTAQLARIGAFYEGSTYMGSLRFYTNANTEGASPSERMRIMHTGFVGIATTSPLTPLHVYRSIAGTIEADRTTPLDVLTLESENTTQTEFTGFGQAIVFRGSTYNNSNQRTIGRILHQINDNSSNTTIGTSLDIQLLTNATGSTLASRFYIGGTGIITIPNLAGTGSRIVVADANGSLSATTLSTSVVGGSGTVNRVAKFTATDTVGDSQIFDNGTSVGIGTVSPAAKLDIRGTSTQDIYLISTTASNVENSIQSYFNNGGGWANFGIKSQNLILYTGPSGGPQVERLYITSTGNVGIGTVTPGGSFHMANVSGAIFGSAAGSIGTLQLTSSSPVSPISGRILFGTDGTGWQLRVAKNTAGSIVDLLFLQDNGNLGVGANNPGAPIHIVRSGGSVNSINVGLIVDFEATAAEQTGAGTAIQFRGKSGGGDIANYNQAQIATNNVGSNNSHGLSFYYKPDAAGALTEGFRLHSNGFVGIGTTTPDSNLQVGSSGTSGGRTIKITDANYGLLLSGGNGPTNNYIQSLGTSIPLYFLSGNANNGNYVFSSTGRMGIGSTSPGGKVHIKQAASEIPLLIDSSAGTNAAYTQYLVGASAGWEVGMAGSGDSFKWFFSYGGFGSANAKVAITSGGNFGIGTSSPTFVTGGGLHVKMASDSNIRITSGSYTGFDLVQAADGVVYLYNRDNTPFVFGTNNTERLRIAANGAVTIYNATTVSTLAGTGTRMVVADANGLLSTQAIPSGGGGSGTVTSVGLVVDGAGNNISVSGSPITTSGTFTLSIPDASATARGVVNTTTQTFAGDKTFTGQTTVNSVRTDITNGGFGMYMFTRYNVTGATTNANVYATVDYLMLNLANGAITGGETFNVTANLNQVAVGGNTGTVSTQPIRGIISGLLGIPTSSGGGVVMNIADFRYFEAKTPDRASLTGHVVQNIYGLKIGQLRGATGYTITNGWGIYQEGSQDNNYFNGSVVIGSATVGNYKLDVTSTFRVNTGTVPVAIESFANPGIGTVASVYSTGTNSTIAFGSQANDTYLVGGFVFIGNQSAKFIVQADTLTGGYDGWGSIGSSAKYMKEVYTNYLVQKQVFSRQTASYTLVSGDRSKVIEMNVGSANTVTVPTNASVAFPIGTQITIIQYGAGQTTIAGSGVTFRSTNNWLKINAQYGSATIIKVGTDEWYVVGNLSA